MTSCLRKKKKPCKILFKKWYDNSVDKSLNHVMAGQLHCDLYHYKQQCDIQWPSSAFSAENLLDIHSTIYTTLTHTYCKNTAYTELGLRPHLRAFIRFVLKATHYNTHTQAQCRADLEHGFLTFCSAGFVCRSNHLVPLSFLLTQR